MPAYVGVETVRSLAFDALGLGEPEARLDCADGST
jgi:hypothetical protein